MTLTLPTIDIEVWRGGDPVERSRVASSLDDALRSSGFLLLVNHGISRTLRADIRSAAQKFFTLSPDAKAVYSTGVGGRGWIPPGAEANSYYGEDADPSRADLKETWTSGRDFRTGDPVIDAAWFQTNIWPVEAPELEALCAEYTHSVRALYLDVLEMCAHALDLDPSWFTRCTDAAPYSLNINRYPALTETATPLDGQFRIRAHTDWGMITILDRQAGRGGLQVETPSGEWEDAPFVEDALTVNIGDLLARWSGDRWRSTRHRVLPPSPEAPDEELVSLIVFLEVEPQTRSVPIDADSGSGVIAGDWLLERASAASVAL